jgi:uncharacterized membrane protein (DUF441 family)
MIAAALCIGYAVGWVAGRGVTVRDARKALAALQAQHTR